MDLREYSNEDLMQSLVAEIAKSTAELKSAQSDLDKISGRLRFALAVLHIVKERKED